MSAVARKQAPRPARPAARYWKGKAPKGVTEVDSDDSDAEEQDQAAGDISLGGEQDIIAEDDEDEEDGAQLRIAEARPDLALKPSFNVALKDVNISRDGKVTVAGREESGRTAMEEKASEDESSDEEEEEGKPSVTAGASEDEESSEYESDSEDEKPKVQFRPVFVPKLGRATIQERDTIAQDTEEALKKRETEAELRKKDSHDMVAETIKRELAEKEKEEQVPDVDDTDDLDPAAEFEAWRLRELGRIKAEKEEELRKEEEREEVERRRALPEEQRMKEDLERASKLREEKPKGQQKFLQKYWHKGAFHQDEEILKRHDFTEATESTVDVSALPKVMQVKNFGKRSRTKYTHLVDQDTTAGNGGFGGIAPIGGGKKAIDNGGCFNCGGPHLKKDCAHAAGPPPGKGPFGAKIDETSWRDRDEGGNDGRMLPPPRPRRESPFRRDSSPRRDSRYRDDYDERNSDRRRDDGYKRRSRSPSPMRRNGYGRGYRDRSQSWDRERDRGRYREEGRRSRSRERTADADRRDKKRRID